MEGVGVGVDGGVVEERNNLGPQSPRNEQAIKSGAQGSTTATSGAQKRKQTRKEEKKGEQKTI